jgi:hypothetical protein
MKQKKLNVVKDDAGLWKKYRSECENYMMKTVHGQEVNTPADSEDHAIDATRYCHMAWNANK